MYDYLSIGTCFVVVAAHMIVSARWIDDIAASYICANIYALTICYAGEFDIRPDRQMDTNTYINITSVWKYTHKHKHRVRFPV